MKKPRNYNSNYNRPQPQEEQEILTPEMEAELSNGKEEGEE